MARQTTESHLCPDLRAKPRKCARCGTGVHSGRVHGLIEPLDNRTIDGEARASELSAAGARNQAILDECQDLEFFTHLTSVALLIASWVHSNN